VNSVSINGVISPKEKAVIPVSHKAYFFDFAVYESIKVIKGKSFFAEDHIERLFKSAELIELEHPFRKPQVQNWLNQLIAESQLKEAYIRIILIGAADNGAQLFIIPLAGVTFYSKKTYRVGMKAVTFIGERRIPNAKSKDLLLNYLALRKATENNAIEALLIDHKGNIREGTRSNFFAIKDGVLFTPPDEKVLEGVTRKKVLGIAAKIMPVKKEAIPLSKISEFDEVFITSTLLNIMPLNQIDNRSFSAPFEKTKKLQEMFKKSGH